MHGFSERFRGLLLGSLLLLPDVCGHIAGAQTRPAKIGSRSVKPCDFGALRGEQGLIVVPENRNVRDSRDVSVHYFRFPAREPAGLPPLFYLPGGPGGFIGDDNLRSGVRYRGYDKITDLIIFNQNRDVVIVNQRGIGQVPDEHKLPGRWTAKAGRSSEPRSETKTATRLAEGFRTAVERSRANGIDLRGYDLMHLVDDVDAIRVAYGYEKIALRGTSFGSQWALAYLKKYPQRVDRMILAGVEPLDHAYDSAQGIWRVFERIEVEARRTGELKLPEVGLMGAVKAIIERLERQPAKVHDRHPRRDFQANILIGPDDFRYYLSTRFPILGVSLHSRRALETWPKFILEIYHGDYQYLAARTIDDRPETYSGNMLLTLVDNSLGISAARLKQLAAEPARRWLGDINGLYTATREVSPAPMIGEEFRRPVVSQVPLLMIHGTHDLATPIENAEELLKHFPNARLIRVAGGTHGATYSAAAADREFVNHLSRFMSVEDPRTTFAELPTVIRLPPLKFKKMEGPSLFEELVDSR